MWKNRLTSLNFIILVIYIALIFQLSPYLPKIWFAMWPATIAQPHFGIYVNYIYMVLFVALFVYVFSARQVERWRFWLLAGCVVGYVMMIKHFTLPIERTKFAEYFILIVLLHNWLKGFHCDYFFIFLIACSIGLASELYQSILPMRVFQIGDILINCASSLFGLIIVRVIRR